MTDNINPEYQHPNDSTPPASGKPEKKSNGLAILALILGGIGTGIGAYNVQQAQKRDLVGGQDSPAIAQLDVAVQQQSSAIKSLATKEEVAQLSQKVTQLSEKEGDSIDIGALQSQFASVEEVKALADRLEALSKQDGSTTGVDRAELEKMVNNAIAASQLTPEQVKAMAGGAGVSEEQVQSLINQSLANFSQGDNKIDLSKEIAAVQASEAGAKEAAAAAQAAAEKVSENATAAQEKLDAAVDQKLETLKQALGEVNSSASNPYPLLNALKLAQLAAADDNLIGARNYLAQAKETFALFALTDSAYANFQGDVEGLYQQYEALAGKASPSNQINAIIDELGSWQFRTVDPVKNALEAAAPADDQSGWSSALRGVGQSILNNTISVTPIDDAGLAWINADETLQNILRENVRLDLSFLRNALQLGNQDDYNKVADRLIEQVKHYFDGSNPSVASALQTLENLKSLPSHGAEISALVERIEQTK